MEKIQAADEDWKIAVVRGLYITFQNSSCFFVLLIVLLRLSIVRNPMLAGNIKEASVKVTCAIIWALALFLNMLPVISALTITEENRSKLPMMVCYIIVLHVGITVPLAMTIISKLYLIFYLREIKDNSNPCLKKVTENGTSLPRLINGLVVWLIVCNVPYIVWYHWSLDLYIRTGKFLYSVEGV